jgi:hypothetical protein
MSKYIAKDLGERRCAYSGRIVVGWRWWRLYRLDMLHSVSTNVPWPPFSVVRETRPLNSGYGLMAFKSRALAEAGQAYGSVLGTVELWGNVVEHEFGYRAEYARIRSLDFIAEHIADHQALRRLYGCFSNVGP